jgi:hypothetical protein
MVQFGMEPVAEDEEAVRTAMALVLHGLIVEHLDVGLALAKSGVIDWTALRVCIVAEYGEGNDPGDAIPRADWVPPVAHDEDEDAVEGEPVEGVH